MTVKSAFPLAVSSVGHVTGVPLPSVSTGQQRGPTPLAEISTVYDGNFPFHDLNSGISGSSKPVSVSERTHYVEDYITRATTTQALMQCVLFSPVQSGTDDSKVSGVPVWGRSIHFQSVDHANSRNKTCGIMSRDFKVIDESFEVG